MTGDRPMTEPLPASVQLTPDAPDRAADWATGVAFDVFLPTAADNVGLWTSNHARALVPPDLLARVAAVPGPWRLLVLSEDWCGDAANTVPVMAAFADATPALELRLLARDQHLDLMDAHLTGGTSRSIPVALLLDAAGLERAWWGPRPAPLQAWFYGPEAQALEKPDRYRELRKWYARDRGRTTLDEIVRMIEAAA